MYPVILLAGGKSSRMGTAKGLLNYHGRPWLIEQIGRLSQVGVQRIILVLGYGAADYFSSIPWLKNALDRPFQIQGLELSVLINELPEHGPFSSLLRGIQFSRSHSYLMPIDLPCPNQSVWNDLASALGSSHQAVIPTLDNRGGHPILLSRSMISILDRVFQNSLNSSNFKQARLDIQIRLLDSSLVQRVPVLDPKVHLNLNSPEKWDHFLVST